MASFSYLPQEVAIDILYYLPIQSLLDFGLTSSYNRKLQLCSLSNLRLGVFSSKFSAQADLADVNADNDCLHSVQIVLSRKESRNKKYLIYMQDQRIQSVVQMYRYSLRVLEITLCELKESTAQVLAQLRNLKHMSICLDQSHSRHSSSVQDSQQSLPGSTAWNLLAPKPGKSGVLGRLNSLKLARGGITDYQLRQLLVGNPGIRELRLHQCTNLTRETFRFLAMSHLTARLKILHFTEVNRKHIDERILKHIGRLRELKVPISSHRIPEPGML